MVAGITISKSGCVNVGASSCACPASGDHRGSPLQAPDRKSTRLNSSHEWISYAVFCLKKKTEQKSLSTSPRDHSRQRLSRLPPAQTRGDSVDLPAQNPK